MRRLASFLSASVIWASSLRMSGVYCGVSGAWPTDMPTRICIVLVTLLSAKKDGTGKRHQGLQSAIRIVHQVIIKHHLARLKQQHQCAAAKLKVPQLLAPLDLLPWLARDDSAADHHGT